MEKLCKELEEMKFSMESLTEECRAKSAFSDNLKRVNNEQLLKLQEARAKIEKQAKEIDEKDEEISVSNQMCEDLKSKLSEKEAALKHLRLANENLRVSFAEKAKKMEEENKQLVLALEESNSRGEEQCSVIHSCKQEIERLKGVLSVTQKKCVDAEEGVKAPREVRRRDEMITKLERDKGEVEEQLKWRSEQFRHLEEAHDKIQNKYRAFKKEWEVERSNLVDEVSSLQASLDSQTRVAEDLRSKLQMCNQVLAREESRRKLLEIQMSESKALYENVMSEYEETRVNIKSVTERRDEEIAELRNSLATKATSAKELEFRTTHLEQENEELRLILKEFRENQINGVGAVASFKSLQQKFRALEQAHRDCSEKLKARDAEWSAETEKLGNELDDCLLKLNNKDKQLQDLQAELEVSNSLLVQQNLEYEEISVVLLLLTSKFLESCSLLQDLKHESELHGRRTEEKIGFLMEQLEKKNNDLVRAEAEIKCERERANSLLSKARFAQSVEQECLWMQKEISSYKWRLEESFKILEQLKEQAAHREFNLSEDIKKALAALDEANYALAEKSNQLNEVEFDLERSKLVVERMEKMRCNLEAEVSKCHDESLLIRRDLENLLLAKLEAEKELKERKESFLQMLNERDKKIEDLQQQLVVHEENMHALEASLRAKLELEKSSKKENQKLLQFVEDMDRRLRSNQKEVDSLGQNYVLREIRSLMELEEERTKFQQTMEEKEKIIADMQHKILSYVQYFPITVIITASIKQRDVQMELCALNEALEKVLSVYILDEQEIYYKNSLVAELEEEILSLQVKGEEEKTGSVDIKMQLEEGKVRFQQVMEEKDRVITDMEQKNLPYEQDFLRSVETAASIKQRDPQMELCSLSEALEKMMSVYILDKQEICNKNFLIAELEEEIHTVQLKSEEEKMGSVEILMMLDEERNRYQQVMEERGKVIADMQQKILSHEQDFLKCAEISTSIGDAQMEFFTLNKALEGINAVFILDQQEIYYRNYLVAQLEEEIHSLQLKVEFEEKLSLGLKNCADELEAKLSTVLLEKEKDQVQFDIELKNLQHRKATLETQVEYEKKVMLESIVQLSSEREELVTLIMGLGEMIGNLSDKGEEIKRQWDRIMQISTDENANSRDVEVEDQSSFRKLNLKNLDSHSKAKAGQFLGRRLPLKEHNY